MIVRIFTKYKFLYRIPLNERNIGVLYAKKKFLYPSFLFSYNS